MIGLSHFFASGILVGFNASSIPTFWFVLPLVVAMSCVYSASRHESWSKIVPQSLRLFGMIVGVLLVAMTLLLILNTQV